jgi:hypothetical protein
MAGEAYLWALLLGMIMGAPGYSGECCTPLQEPFLERMAPAGGWHPYGGGLLHWWNPCCFPCCGAPDDYCRKPLPKFCWPAYPPYYIWGAPEGGHPPTSSR